MPAVTTASLPTILTFSARMLMALFRQQHHLDHETGEEHQRDGGQDQRHAQVALFLLGRRHTVHLQAKLPSGCCCAGGMCTAGACFSGCTRASSTLVAVASRRGGVSKVWKGAGDGTSHSRPSAPLPSASFQGRCGAFSPLPRMQGSTMK